MATRQALEGVRASYSVTSENEVYGGHSPSLCCHHRGRDRQMLLWDEVSPRRAASSPSGAHRPARAEVRSWKSVCPPTWPWDRQFILQKGHVTIWPQVLMLTQQVGGVPHSGLCRQNQDRAPGRPQVRPLLTEWSWSFRKCIDFLPRGPRETRGRHRGVSAWLSFPSVETPTAQKHLGVSLTALLSACRLWDVLSEPRVRNKPWAAVRPEHGDERVPEKTRPWQQCGVFHRESVSGSDCLKAAQGGQIQGRSLAPGSPNCTHSGDPRTHLFP